MKKEKKEEWGGWKIVSDMLDHPDENGIYPTSECYQKLYGFVMAQKEEARQEERERIKKLIIEEMNICRKEGQPTSRLTSLYNNLI